MKAEQSPISRLNDIDGLAGEEVAEKTKLMTNNTSGINTEIKVIRQKLETATGFKYWAQL